MVSSEWMASVRISLASCAPMGHSAGRGPHSFQMRSPRRGLIGRQPLKGLLAKIDHLEVRKLAPVVLGRSIHGHDGRNLGILSVNQPVQQKEFLIVDFGIARGVLEVADLDQRVARHRVQVHEVGPFGPGRESATSKFQVGSSQCQSETRGSSIRTFRPSRRDSATCRCPLSFSGAMWKRNSFCASAQKRPPMTSMTPAQSRPPSRYRRRTPALPTE